MQQSLALREIEGWCVSDDSPRKVIGTIEVEFPASAAEAEALLRRFESTPAPGTAFQADSIYIGVPTFRQNPPVYEMWAGLADLRAMITSRNVGLLRSWFTRAYTTRLDGRTRFLLTDDKPTGDLLRHPQNHLQALFQDGTARAQVRVLTEEAFGTHFVIDPTAVQNFRIRMSPRAPKTEEEEQSLSEASRDFHRQAEHIVQSSDGVKAFVGLTSAVLSLPHRIIIIDEPEAFLHPPLARTLGRNLAKIAAARGASLVVATHSASFLLGCVETGVQTDVVRLTYERGVPTARLLNAAALTEMMLDPFMRSAGVLAALFHRAAVVTESDADRSFYDEINFRLQGTGRGIRDTLFLNANGKDSLHKIAGPLRKLGIPAAVIADLDVLRSSGAAWKNLLDACAFPTDSRDVLQISRAEVVKSLDAIAQAGKPHPIKLGGVKLLSGPQAICAQKLLGNLAENGLFVAERGELESWLPSLGSSCHGPPWLVETFGKMGSNPSDPGYLQPTADDVWAFLDKVAMWADNPNRKGIP